MRIVLDTGVFYHPAALREAARQGLDVVVPVVAFTERARQLARDGRPVGEFLAILEEHGFAVEPLTVREALRLPVRVRDDRLWLRHARDALIAGHVGRDDVLWTTNRADFERIGLDPHQIQDVP